MLTLKRTDSTTIIKDDDNKICVVMSPLKMKERINYIEYNLKNKLNKLNISHNE